MTVVFISYRRDDTAGEARALYNALVAGIGETQVFLDVDGIPPGADFRDEIRKRLDESTLMLVLIGRGWLDAVDATGRRRLENPSDYVRLEIEYAFKHNIVVTPVLVQGASMPAAEQLPEAIREFAYREAFDARHDHWNRDVAELLRHLGHERRPRRVAAIGASVAVVLALVAFGGYLTREPAPQPPAPTQHPTPAGVEGPKLPTTVVTTPVPSTVPPRKPGVPPATVTPTTSSVAVQPTVEPTTPADPKPATEAAVDLAELRSQARSAVARLQGPEGADTAAALLSEIFPQVQYGNLTPEQLISELGQQVTRADAQQLQRLLARRPTP